MSQSPGTSRPGGRTSRTRSAVHAAVAEILGEGGGPVTVAEVADRSGVHPATIYRRWRSPEALVLDAATQEVADRSPLVVTGDLRADLLVYGAALRDAVHRPGGLGLFRAIVAATAEPDTGLAGAREALEPRLRQFRTVLDADGTTELTADDLFELLLAPLYVAALLAGPDHTAAGRVPADSGPHVTVDVVRLVDNVLAVRDHRRARPAT